MTTTLAAPADTRHTAPTPEDLRAQIEESEARMGARFRPSPTFPDPSPCPACRNRVELVHPRNPELTGICGICGEEVSAFIVTDAAKWEAYQHKAALNAINAHLAKDPVHATMNQLAADRGQPGRIITTPDLRVTGWELGAHGTPFGEDPADEDGFRAPMARVMLDEHGVWSACLYTFGEDTAEGLAVFLSPRAADVARWIATFRGDDRATLEQAWRQACDAAPILAAVDRAAGCDARQDALAIAEADAQPPACECGGARRPDDQG